MERDLLVNCRDFETAVESESSSLSRRSKITAMNGLACALHTFMCTCAYIFFFKNGNVMYLVMCTSLFLTSIVAIVSCYYI